MYLTIGKGQIAQKDHIRAKIDLRAKLRVNIVFRKLADPVPMLLQVVNGSSTQQLCMQNGLLKKSK